MAPSMGSAALAIGVPTLTWIVLIARNCRETRGADLRDIKINPRDAVNG